MATEPALAALVAARLAATAGVPGTVGDAADLSSARGGTLTFPAAFVIPLAEAAGPNALGAGAVEQRRTVRVGVVLAVRNLRARGGEALQGIEALRGAVDAALLGWPPADRYDPLLFGSGKLVSMEDGVMWWQDEYLTAYLSRSAQA